MTTTPIQTFDTTVSDRVIEYRTKRAPVLVDLWWVDLDRSQRWTVESHGLLTPDERRRAARFHRDRDRERWIAGRSTLRRILAQYLGCGPEELLFGYGEQGKPYLRFTGARSASGLHFNLAHSGPRALLAVTWRGRVGVDLERVRPIPELEAIARRVMSHVEQQRFAGVPDSRRLQTFFELWVRKEALLKGMGDGLSRPPSTLELPDFLPDSGPPAEPPALRIRRSPHRIGNWSLVPLEAKMGFRAALAVEASPDFSPSELRVRRWTR